MCQVASHSRGTMKCTQIHLLRICHKKMMIIVSVVAVFFFLVIVAPQLGHLQLTFVSNHHVTNRSQQTARVIPAWPPQFKAYVPLCHVDKPRDAPMRHDVWYVAQGDSAEQEVNIFRAYFDDRPNVGPSKYIRLLTIDTTSTDTQLYSHLWYDHLSAPVVTSCQVSDVGRGLPHKGRHYMERFYSCDVPNIEQRPSHLSVGFDKCKSASPLIPIVFPERERKYDFGICVAVAYGNIDPVRLIEWIEFQRILGVGEINLYNSSLNSELTRVFHYYNRSGILKLHQSSPPMDDKCHWCHKLATIPVFNDCLYRNMYRYRRTVVIDLDEYIIPHRHSSLAELVRYLDSIASSSTALPTSKQPASFMFRNAYFFLDFKPEPAEKDVHLGNASSTAGSSLMTISQLTRIVVSSPGYAAKSIIDPLRCLVVQNHFCQIRTPDVGSSWTFAVDPEVALSHHYKRCHFSAQQCRQHLASGTRDNATIAFHDHLLQNVHRVLLDIELEEPKQV